VEVLKQDLKWNRVATTENAIKVPKQLWNLMPQVAINRLVASFRTSKLLRDVQGRQIQLLASAHNAVVPPQYSFRHVNMKPWHAAEKDLLLELGDPIGRLLLSVEASSLLCTERQLRSRCQIVITMRCRYIGPLSGSNGCFSS
jgi:hypothetical protein